MNVTVIRTGAQGDALWAEPIVSSLVSAGHRVAVKTACPDMFVGVPGATVTAHPNSANTVIDLDWAYEKDPKRHVLDAYIRVAKRVVPIQYLRRPPNLYPGPDEKWLSPCDEPFIVVSARYYHYAHNYRKVAGVDWAHLEDTIIKRYGVRVFRTFDDRVPMKSSVIQSKTLRDIIPYLKHAKAFLGVDSAPSHMAAAFGTPAAIFFGGVNPLYRHLDSDNKVFLQNGCDFAGCYHTVPDPVKDPRAVVSCRFAANPNPAPCTLVTNEQIISALDSFLPH